MKKKKNTRESVIRYQVTSNQIQNRQDLQAVQFNKAFKRIRLDVKLAGYPVNRYPAFGQIWG